MDSQKEVTIYDIAKALNISAATVSRGLKDHPGIANATKKKIFDKASAMGYRFNTFASNLRSKHTRNLGILVPRLNSTFMSDAIAGIESVANREGYSVIISQSLEEQEKEARNAMLLFHNRVDGLIVSLAANTHSADHFLPFIRRKIPLVFFDRVLQQEACPAIVIDNYRAAYEITKHLIDTGRKRILHISGNTQRNVYADRLRGYKDALLDYGMKYDDQLVISSALSPQDGVDIANQIYQSNFKPDAVFAANDACAVHCMLSLKNRGIDVPGQIAFAGFNDDPLCTIAEPNLTTIRYPGYEMGEIAAQTLIDRLNGQTTALNTQTVILRHELLIRASSM